MRRPRLFEHWTDMWVHLLDRGSIRHAYQWPINNSRHEELEAPCQFKIRSSHIHMLPTSHKVLGGMDWPGVEALLTTRWYRCIHLIDSTRRIVLNPGMITSIQYFKYHLLSYEEMTSIRSLYLFIAKQSIRCWKVLPRPRLKFTYDRLYANSSAGLKLKAIEKTLAHTPSHHPTLFATMSPSIHY